MSALTDSSASGKRPWGRVSRRVHAAWIVISAAYVAIALEIVFRAHATVVLALVGCAIGAAAVSLTIQQGRRSTARPTDLQPAPSNIVIEHPLWTAWVVVMVCAPFSVVLIAGLVSWPFAAVGIGGGLAQLVFAAADALGTHRFEKRHDVTVLLLIRSRGRIDFKGHTYVALPRSG